MDYTTNRNENIHLPESEAAAEEAEEALSLSGLILNSDDAESTTDYSGHFQEARSRSSSEPSDFFEFFSEISSEMSHAEDIIFCGRLLPSYKEQPQPNRYTGKQHTAEDKLQSVRRRRSESMSEINSISRSNGTKFNLMRSSRSLDYQKLYGKPKKMEIERSLSAKSAGSKTDVSLKEKVPPPRPRWYFLKFGLVKFPPEMALQDIKNRRVRRNPGSLFSSFHSGERDLQTNKYDRRSSWDDLLRVLSCKDDASVAVTTSFGCLQHV